MDEPIRGLKDDLDAFSLPHRRPNYTLNAPAVVLTLCFRPESRFDPIAQSEESASVRTRGRYRIDPLNAYISVVGGPDAPQFVVDNIEVKFPQVSLQRSLAFIVPAGAAGLPVDVIINSHTEYFTITYRAYPAFATSSDERVKQAGKVLRRLVNSSDDGDWPDDASAEAARKAIYDDIWTFMFEHVPAPDFPYAANPDLNINGYAHVFARIKGSILRIGNFTAQERSFNEHADPSHARLRPLVPPWPQGWRKGEMAGEVVDVLNARSRFFSHLLEFRRGSDRIRDFRGGNSVLCGVLDGLAAYGSTLGDHYTDAPPDAKSNEIRFFILYAGPSRNQLGRLLDRIVACGENRIAALFDFNDIRDAGDDMRRLDQEISAVGDFVPADVLKSFRAKLDTASRMGRGGLMHRTGRSQHYAANLRNRIRELRIVRIIGWQPYDEFVQRNVEPQLSTLQRLGSRYRDLDDRVRRMSVDSVVLESAAIAKESTALAAKSTALAEEGHKMSKLSVRVARTAHGFQLAAEIFAIVASISYVYAGAVATREVLDTGGAIDKRVVWLAFAVLCLIIFAAFIAWRLPSHRRSNDYYKQEFED